MKYKAVIFDLDGTILDTLKDLTISTNYALVKNGFPERTMDEVRRFVGNGIARLIAQAVPDETDEAQTKQTLEDFKAHYGVHCADFTCPYDKIPGMLQVLREKKIPLAVVSNKADFAVQELCRKYFPGMFDIVVGERDGIRKKPCPDSVQEVLRILDISAPEAVYVGDSEVDVQTALNAGMDLIAVSWGFRGREMLLASGALCIADDPDEVLNYLG